MINLLPPENKRQIRAGQANILLLRYCIATLLLSIPLFLLIGGVYFLLDASKKTANETIQDSAVKSAQYQEVQAKSQEFSNNLRVAKSILDKEVRYSKIAVVIAQSLPSGVFLESLSLDAKTFGQPIALSAAGKTYDDAIRLKKALEESPNFKDINLQSVSKKDDSAAEYPISITLNVTINPEITRS